MPPCIAGSAVNTPVIALFGPSGVFDWGPWPNGWMQMDENPYPAQNGIQQSGIHTTIQQQRMYTLWERWPLTVVSSDCLETLSTETIKQINQISQKLIEHMIIVRCIF